MDAYLRDATGAPIVTGRAWPVSVGDMAHLSLAHDWTLSRYTASLGGISPEVEVKFLRDRGFAVESRLV